MDGGVHEIRRLDVTLREELEGWRDDAARRRDFLAALAAAPFEAFFFELPAITAESLERPFECMLLDAPRLAARRLDPHTFAEHFAAAPAEARVTVFDSLGGDARLVVPLPEGDGEHCVHLARFVRSASAEARDALWAAVARELLARLRSRPLWLSTNGLGVSWLHVRIDTQPKYFQHAPYKSLAPPPRDA